MTERDRGGEETVEPGIFLLGSVLTRGLAGVEHVEVSHAEVAAQAVQLAEVEIHQPGVLGRPVGLVLAVVAVGQAAVEGVVVSFGIDRAVPRLLLEQHDLAERVEDGRQRPRAGTRAS